MPFFSDSTEELRELSFEEWSVIFLVSIAGFFTCFNFIVYFLFNDAIIHAFFPKDLNHDFKQLGFLALVLVGYVARPLGGVVLSHIADRFGRKKVMLYSLVTIVLTTFGIAMLPTYAMIGSWAVLLLVLVRMAQGVGIGAEIPISWAYVLECMPFRHLGWVSGIMIASLILPVLFANFLYVVLSEMLTVEQMIQFGWRVPFLIGAIGSLVTIVLRYRLTETPIWLMAQQKGEVLSSFPIRQVIKKYRYGLIMTLLLSWFTSSIYLIVYLLLPELAVNYFDVDYSQIMIANSVAIVFACLGSILFGYCADKFNYGRVFGTGCILLGLSSIVFFYYMAKDADFILLYYVIFGFFSGIIGIVPSICARFFHTKVRCTGLAVGYNLAYAGTGAFVPFLLVYSSLQLTLAPALYVAFLCVVGVLLSILLSHLHGLYRIEKHS